MRIWGWPFFSPCDPEKPEKVKKNLVFWSLRKVLESSCFSLAPPGRPPPISTTKQPPRLSLKQPNPSSSKF